MDVGIIGCGLIGEKRAVALTKVGGDKLRMVCDVDLPRAERMAAKYNCAATSDWQAVLDNKEIGIVVIAVVHADLAKITDAAIAKGKHVLVEKPAGRNRRDLEPVVGHYRQARERGLKVKVGFNHRFHPALKKAKAIVDSGKIGDLMFIRGRYGHGGRIGYDKEWRAVPKISGGGELLDQGMHLIDLSRWFLGDFPKVRGTTKTYFWDMPVDDNAFMTLETAKQQVAHLHVTWTEWKNLFSFEIYGRHGKLHCEGLGGSYGVERLYHYQMLPEMGPPVTVIDEFPGADLSWEDEWRDFRAAINENRAPCGDLIDAYEALIVVDLIYRENGHDYR